MTIKATTSQRHRNRLDYQSAIEAFWIRPGDPDGDVGGIKAMHLTDDTNYFMCRDQMLALATELIQMVRLHDDAVAQEAAAETETVDA